MEHYDVEWSRESVYDVADIADYIELRFGMARAEQFNDEIDKEGGSLGSSYKFYAGTGLYYRGYLILKKVFDPSIIFYYVDHDMKKVYIIRVLRHECNWQKLLRDATCYTFD